VFVDSLRGCTVIGYSGNAEVNETRKLLLYVLKLLRGGKNTYRIEETRNGVRSWE
jgi:hypothetical protein